MVASVRVEAMRLARVSARPRGSSKRGRMTSTGARRESDASRSASARSSFVGPTRMTVPNRAIASSIAREGDSRAATASRASDIASESWPVTALNSE